MDLCAIKENFWEEETRGGQLASGPSASAHHHAHLHSPGHAGWPLPIGLCACLPGQEAGPGAGSGKRMWLSHAHAAIGIPVAGAPSSAGVSLCWFSKDRVNDTATPSLEALSALLSWSGLGPTLPHAPRPVLSVGKSHQIAREHSLP